MPRTRDCPRCGGTARPDRADVWYCPSCHARHGPGLEPAPSLRELLTAPHLAPAALTALLGSIALAANLARDTPHIHVDAGVFILGGWSWTQGRPPYVYLFDIKPPLPWELHAALATVAPSRGALFAASATIGLVAFVATASSLTRLAAQYTGSTRAGVVAGLAVPAFPLVASWSAVGLRPKWLALALALAAWSASLREQHARAAALAALAAATWQLALVFIAGALLAAARDSRRALTRAGIVTLGVAVAVVAPVVAAGGASQLVAQAVLAPLVVDDTETPLVWILRSARLTPLILTALPGAIGLALGLVRERDAWLTLVTAWSAFAFVVVDRDGVGDLWLPVLLLGLGLAFAYHYDRGDSLAAGAGRGLILGGLAFGVFMTAASIFAVPPGQGGANTMMRLFWDGAVPQQCHLRMSKTEQFWLVETGINGGVERCRGVLDALQAEDRLAEVVSR